MTARRVTAVVLGGAGLVAALAAARGDGPPRQGGPPPFGPFGPGGPGGAVKLVGRFDADGDGRLDAAERKQARAALAKERPAGGRRGPFGLGPPPPFGRAREPGRPGPRVAPGEAAAYPDAPLYDPAVLRTLFLEFEAKDWEAELADFHGTDVEVPATLTVDGRAYPNVGVHFRGMSSYMMVPAGSKRSLNVSLDFADAGQRLYGSKTLNLLNAHEDPSFLSTVLYSHIARQYIPAPKANLVKVVINGESWGVYASVQQFDKVFAAENYKQPKGTRWKVRGSPGGGGGLDYLGDDINEYKRRYEMKSSDGDKAWAALVHLCRVLDRTPAGELEAALTPILDVDGLLWFLALDVALVNNDGYWVRASDYSLFRDAGGRFHVIPHDMNEAFRPAMMGPGFFGRGGGDLDPLVGLDDRRKPLRGKVLAVPTFRKLYLQHVRTIADEWLDWKKLGPVVAGYRKLVEKEVEADTRKLESAEAFRSATADGPAAGGGPGRHVSLRAFADRRREFLLNHPEVKKAGE